MSDLAYSARVTMHSAAWGDETGSVVTFKLPMTKDAEDVRNPFHSFTKRRKGRAGTRFMMVCHTAGEVRHALYEDEVMLAGWNDSQQNGHTAKLWIASDAMGHPFEGVGRKQELIISLVELDDDNEPIDQKMRDRVEKQGIHPQSRLSYAAVMLCKNDMFWQWCRESDYTLAGNPIVDEESAKLWIYLMCRIESRAELNDPEKTIAISKFEEILRDFTAAQEKLF
jgi:hypothetical protein